MTEGPVGQGPLQAGSPLRTPRAAAVAGVVFSVFLIAALVLLRLSAPAHPGEAAAWLTEPEGFSLPSKHTTLAALTAGACAGSAGLRDLPRHAVPLLAAAGVGASRVYLGVHWPSDILAGWLFAEGWLGLAESVAPGRAGRPGCGIGEAATR